MTTAVGRLTREVTRPLVVLIRPWADVAGGGGCCSGPEPRDGVVIEPRQGTCPDHVPASVQSPLGRAYRTLRSEIPEADVQIVSAGNLLYLLPSVVASTLQRLGWRAAVSAATQATTPGAVLVDGVRAGDVTELTPEQLVSVVRARC